MLKPRLLKHYQKVVSEDLILLYNFQNINALPVFENLTLNSTSSNFTVNNLFVMQTFAAWFLISSQKCIQTRAVKSLAFFKIRKNDTLGFKITCRKFRLFALLDKFLIWVLPRLHSKSVKVSASKTNSQLNAMHFASCCASTCRASTKQVGAAQVERSYRNKSTTKIDFFTISHTLSRVFPEVLALDQWLDSRSGFGSSCSIINTRKVKTYSSFHCPAGATKLSQQKIGNAVSNKPTGYSPVPFLHQRCTEKANKTSIFPSEKKNKAGQSLFGNRTDNRQKSLSSSVSKSNSLRLGFVNLKKLDQNKAAIEYPTIHNLQTNLLSKRSRQNIWNFAGLTGQKERDISKQLLSAFGFPITL